MYVLDVGLSPGPGSVLGQKYRQGTERTGESDGGQFPSHQGRPGPKTSSEGAHLEPNPQEIHAGLAPSYDPSHLFSFHLSISPCFSWQTEKPRKFKASVRARANPRAAFPRARADEILCFARKNYRGRGEKKQKIKLSKQSGKIKEERRWGARSWSSETCLTLSCVYKKKAKVWLHGWRQHHSASIWILKI